MTAPYTMADVDARGIAGMSPHLDRLRATVAERDALKADLAEAERHVAWLLPKARCFWRAHETPAPELDAARAWLKQGGGK